MSRIDRLIAEAAKQSCEAIVMSSMRQAQFLGAGVLRPFSNRPLTTDEILALVTEVAPGEHAGSLAGDCEFKFRYQGDGLPRVEMTVDRKADFVFVRMDLSRLPAPAPRPPTPVPPPPASPSRPAAQKPSRPPAAVAPPVASPAAAPVPVLPDFGPSIDFGATADFGAFSAPSVSFGPPPGADAAPAASGGTLELPVVGSSLELDSEGAFRGADPTAVSGGDFEFGAARDFDLPLEPTGLELDLERSAPAPAPPAAPPAPPPPPQSPAEKRRSGVSDSHGMPAAPFGGASFSSSPLGRLVTPEPPRTAARPAPVTAPSAPPAPAARAAAPAPVSLRELLAQFVSRGGSDLHLAAGSPPRIRLCGELVPMGETALAPAQTQAMFEEVLTPEQRERFLAEQALDFSLELPGVGRFRANAYRQRKGLDLVFRAIPSRIPTLAELGLPESVGKLTQFPNGLILVTGPAGCGKSTTQAALIDRINETWRDHVITIEDPVEFVHPAKNCLVNQREVGTHVRTFAEALRSALREDPDVILVGELRDLETIQLAITAAETGHLVLGTLHTVDAARTIDRLVDVFPAQQKGQMRSMVSESLRGVVSQRLLPAAEGTGRVAAFEVLLTDRPVANLIREGKTFQIPNVLRTGRARGMCSMDDSILALLQAKKITQAVALAHLDHPEELEKQLAQKRAARRT